MFGFRFIKRYRNAALLVIQSFITPCAHAQYHDHTHRSAEHIIIGSMKGINSPARGRRMMQGYMSIDIRRGTNIYIYDLNLPVSEFAAHLL